MFPGVSLTSPPNLNPSSPQDRSRQNLPYVPTQSGAYNFGASGNMNSTSHSHSWNPIGSGTSNQTLGAAGSTLNDTLAQSRPQYQTGYLMSLAQGQSGTQGGQRFEDAPLIATKAKMNPAFSRTSPSDFGTESMFESSKHRRRENYDDEDGPPTSSIFDIVNDVHADSFDQRLKPRHQNNSSRMTSSAQATTPPHHTSHHTLYIIVFGYPPSRYSSTVAYFRSLAEGGTTEAEMSPDVENAFKIGYKQPMEAARAWRRNGEIINGDGGRWMVGAKWADPQTAEQLLGSAVRTSSFYSPAQPVESPGYSAPDDMDVAPDSPELQVQRIGLTHRDSSSTIGTPIKLAPSTSAFRKGGNDSMEKGRGGGVQEGGASVLLVHPGGTGSPARGMLGQVSDLIFGW
ncbi:hypothetical protein BD410DRAFT_786822 [Rickenella mellea]|uniref:RRM Nup35-type domain-containing protein n=1 Tax=Rickenella mellea TaxID=50990 RepID=A0A4Y7Q8F4_9AGAM|nr:hypothetical protein BD410DRAFT_786822 [Rickenella mellea]